MSERSKVMVTGASGFFGATMMEHLSHDNVVGVTRNTETEIADRLNLKKLDTGNREDTARFIYDHLPDTIFHFYGVSRPKEVEEKPQIARIANIDSVLNILGAIHDARKNFTNYNPCVVVSGSVEQIGDSKKSEQILDETSPRNPQNLYATQKQEMSETFLSLCKKLNIDGYVVLQGPATGSSPSGEVSQSLGFLIPDMAAQIALAEQGETDGVVLTGNISHKRNIVNINDAIASYIALATKKPISGEYLVCADKSVALSYVLKVMIKNAKINLTHEIESTRGFGQATDRYYSHQKITTATGWMPKTSIEETAIEVLNFQRKQQKELDGVR